MVRNRTQTYQNTQTLESGHTWVVGNNPNTNQTTSPHSYPPTRYGGLTQERSKHENLQPHS